MKIESLIKRNLWPILFMIISIALWGFSLSALYKSSSQTKTIGLRYQDATIMQSTLKHIDMEGNEDGPVPNFVAWAQDSETTALDEFSGRSQSAKLIRAYGDLSLLIAPSRFLDGYAPGIGDQDGCAISTEFSRKLWGSEKTTGLEFVLDGRNYTVRGVFEDENAILLRQNHMSENQNEEGQAQTAKGFSCIEFEARFTADGKMISSTEQIRDFLQKTSLPQQKAFVNYGQAESMFRMTSILPCLFLLIIFWTKAIRQRAVFESAIIWKMIYVAIFLVSLFAFLWLIRENFFWSRDYLPSQWSNFEFWSDLIKQFGNEIRNLLELPGNDLDLERRANQLKMIVSLTLSLFMIFPAIGRRKAASLNENIFASVLALLAAASCTILFKIPYERIYWWAWTGFYFALAVLFVLAQMKADLIKKQSFEGNDNERNE